MPRIKDKFGQGGANLTSGGQGKPSLAEVLDTVTRQVGDPVWATQEEWYIDPENGDDSYDGASEDFPLKTLGEFGARLRDQQINQPTTIWILNDVPATDQPVLRFSIGDYGFVRFRGKSTIVASGTFTSVTDLNIASSQPNEVEDTALSDTWVNLGLIDKRLRITSGARENAQAWLVKDLGSKQARISSWLEDPYPSTPPWSFTGISNVNAQIGDPYVVEELTSILELPLDVWVSSRYTGTGVSATKLFFEDLNIAYSAASNLPRFSALGLNPLAFIGCKLLHSIPGQGGWGQYANCQCAAFHSMNGASLWIRGGYMTFQFDPGPGSYTLFSGSPIAQGIRIRAEGLMAVSGGGLGAFDSSSDGIKVMPQATLSCSDYVFGSGNTEHGIEVAPYGCVVYSAGKKPVITGTAGDSNIGGSTKTWAENPYIETTNNAGIVQDV